MAIFVGTPCDNEAMSTAEPTPHSSPDSRWTVLDVETTGTDPAQCRVISVAALTVGHHGGIEDQFVSLLDPGVDPGPTRIHGLTRAMLAGSPTFPDIAPTLARFLRGRTLVAHNVGFDHAFLDAEARRAGLELPVASVMCTVKLAARLNLGTANLKLATLAQHWGITQARPHDALDDAVVLARVLARLLARAQDLRVDLPIDHPSTLARPRPRFFSQTPHLPGWGNVAVSRRLITPETSGPTA